MRKILARRLLLNSTILLGFLAASLAIAPSPSFASGGVDHDHSSIKGKVSARPSKYSRDVVVHLVKVPGKFQPPRRPAKVDQKGMKFVPHVLAIVRGTTVKFLNNDNVRHNVFTPDGDKYDLGTWAQGETRTRTFKKSGVYRQLCRVHPEMAAVIVVLDNPYFAVTDAEGRFEIKDVPPGTYKVRAWGEKLKESTQSVTVVTGKHATVSFDLRKK